MHRKIFATKLQGLFIILVILFLTSCNYQDQIIEITEITDQQDQLGAYETLDRQTFAANDRIG